MLLTFFLYFGAISAAPSIHFREYHEKNDGFTIEKKEGDYRAPESLHQFRINMLNRHNELRAKHRNTGSLTMDDGINTIAQNYAEELAAKGTFVYSYRPGYGENLYRSRGDPAFGAASTDAWYNEICDYNFAHPSHNPEYKITDHFTQLVWKDTTSIGIGRATGSKWTYVVANYKAQGNFVDYETNKPGKHYIENVQPTLYDRDQYCSEI